MATAPEDCKTVSSKLTCDLGTVSAKSSLKRTIRLRAKRDVTVSIVGDVSWSRRDPTPEDNQAQTLVTTLLPARSVKLSTLVRGVPAVCTRGGRVKLRLRTSTSSRMTSANILVSGKRVKKLSGKALRKSFVVRGLPRRNTFTLRVTVRMSDSGRLTGYRKLRGCRGRR